MQTETLLWPSGLPDGEAPQGAPLPTLTAYPAPTETANGAAMVVCPGGGYVAHADHENEPIARWLNSLGIAVWVLRYRLSPHFKHPAMLNDASRAVRTVRANVADWKIDPNRIGILGFSAGGHLVTTLATHWDAGRPDHADPIERVSSRPDLVVPIYPVVVMQGPFAHEFCRNCLFGAMPDPELTALYSNELQVTEQTPPMFLVHSRDDYVVPVENSLLLAMALSKARVPFELHVYEGGGHGYGLGAEQAFAFEWPARCENWMRARGFLSSPNGSSPQ